MDSTVRNDKAESGSGHNSAKHGPMLYGVMAALTLVIVTAVVAAAKLSQEARAGAAASPTVVTVARPLEQDFHGIAIFRAVLPRRAR